MTTRLPPAAKLSLAVRKNVRDEYENKKADFDKELSELLGVPWTFDFNPLAIYPYAESQRFAKDQPGTTLRDYMRGAITGLKWVVEVYGEGGKKELNDIVAEHTIQLEVGDPDQIIRNTDLGAVVVDGTLRILFAADSFGSNAYSSLGELALFPALNAAPSEQPLSFLARLGISKNYNEMAEEAQKKFAGMLKRSDITFEPNFEELFGKLLEESKRAGNNVAAIPRWELQFGRHVGSYFAAMAYQLEVLGFGTDEMLREGFNEGVPSGIVKVRLVDTLKRHKASSICADVGLSTKSRSNLSRFLSWQVSSANKCR
ncbi:hypothetical protein C8J57DRAFT_1197570 [Mycena rebaudengoi]|nr:hypothetical protein C8J57DRAFT_1197570 [Mycena rebaudengoi]